MSVVHYAPQTSKVYMGLAADRPAVVAGFGDKFIESDTLKVWLFMQTSAWVQIGVYAAATAPPVVV